ncbi:glycosyltransferase family 2 protein [Thermus sediminis]|uniref:glycosyltransferase family 2 protein n=1 Tax=Thermus sediminis TaxID=1761908 RepID=UPI000E3E9AC7|nr:glycosyltransferase family 2 protein [Thermus sediminis]
MWPTLSVVLPTRNRPHLLRQALLSLLRQTYRRFEAVVAEDGEGEGLGVVEALKEPHIKGVWSGKRGQVGARLRALEVAQGDAVLFLDDDDLLLDPAYLYRVARALKGGEGVAYSGGLLLTPSEAIPYEPGPPGPWLLKDNRILASGTALPRKALQDLGGLDPQMGHYWDWDLWLRAFRAGLPFHYLPGPNVGVRVHGENQSYGANLESRRRDLSSLMAKHRLEGITLKDHLQLALTAS